MFPGCAEILIDLAIVICRKRTKNIKLITAYGSFQNTDANISRVTKEHRSLCQLDFI